MRDRRNILFILIDCLRADVCFDKNRTVKTPVIDSLIKKGTAFTQTVSVASITLPSVGSILTGVYPFLHGLTNFTMINPNCVTLPELLQEAGYNTYAMVSGPLIESRGVSRGFHRYLYRNRNESLFGPWGKELITALQTKQLREPWFLFLHLWELHVPRKVVRAFDSNTYGKNLYERSLASIDYHLGDLMGSLDQDKTIIFLHGDHGENPNYPGPLLRLFLNIFYGDNKKGRGAFKNAFLKLIRRLRSYKSSSGFTLGHGRYLYDFLVRIPLIAVGRGIFPEGRMVNTQTSQVDILPTIIDCLGLSGRIHQRIHGRSLMPLINSDSSIDERPVYLQTGRYQGIRTGRWKYIFNKSNPSASELYDLVSDPQERKNVITDHPEIVKELEEIRCKILSDDLGIHRQVLRLSERERAMVEENLKELGYL
jgi:arylsulfatase A-like enzyme